MRNKDDMGDGVRTDQLQHNPCDWDNASTTLSLRVRVCASRRKPHDKTTTTIAAKIITDLTRYRPNVLELILNCNDCNFTRRRFFGINFKL